MKNKQGAVSYFEETYEISLPRRFFISEKTSASSSSLFLANFSRRPICHTYSFISVTLGKLRRRALLPVPARRWTLSTWLKASGELAEGDGAYESDHAWAPVSYDRAFLATRRPGNGEKCIVSYDRRFLAPPCTVPTSRFYSLWVTSSILNHFFTMGIRLRLALVKSRASKYSNHHSYWAHDYPEESPLH